jgi:hypothetical protein
MTQKIRFPPHKRLMLGHRDGRDVHCNSLDIAGPDQEKRLNKQQSIPKIMFGTTRNQISN